MTEKDKKRRLDKDTLNLVIAVSAVLISAASFYAAYVQSVAAQKQVEAETWPYLQLDHGNYDEARLIRNLYFKVKSAGVGPARVKTLQYYYEGTAVNNFPEFYVSCCLSDEEKETGKARGIANLLTGDALPKILLPHDELLFFSSVETPENVAAWARVDAARWHITATACYCSLLDECYMTDFVADPTPVKACAPVKAQP